MCDKYSGSICWVILRKYSLTFSKFSHEMSFWIVWASYSSSVAIFLLANLLLSIKQRWRPCVKHLKLRLKPDKLIIGTVAEVKGPSNVGVLNFFNWTQQKHQRWINAEITLIVNIHQRCFNVDIWLKMKVEPTYIYRRCFNVDKTMLKQCWLNYVDSTSMNQRCFNIEIWLKMKVEPT